MKCRLCETLNQQKLGVLPGTCTHVLPETSATGLPPPLGQLYHFAGFVPQLRDMMLAACLFRGECFLRYYYSNKNPVHNICVLFAISQDSSHKLILELFVYNRTNNTVLIYLLDTFRSMGNVKSRNL